MYNHLFISDVSKLSRYSREEIEIKCSLQISEKCKDIVTQQYLSAMKTIEINGHYLCFYCANHTKNMGKNSASRKYDFDDDMFKSLNSTKAYLLGWIASDGCIHGNGNTIMIEIHEKDIECLRILADIVCKEYDIKHRKNRPMISLIISSKIMANDICRLLQIQPGKKSDVVKFPEIDDKLKWSFIRGVFEGDGHLQNIEKYSTPYCKITSNSIDMLNSIKEFTKIPCNVNDNYISFFGLNSFDFLNKIYENCSIHNLKRKFDMHQRWIQSGWQPQIGGKGNSKNLSLKNCFAYKTNINAIIPNATNDPNIFNITILKEHKIIDDKTILYDTGIKFSIPRGYFIEVFALPLLEEMGYIFPNNVIIVNSSYLGNLYIPLTKISPDAQEINLPLLCCQMTIKQGRIY